MICGIVIVRRNIRSRLLSSSKSKEIRKQLVYLLHGNKCQQIEDKVNKGTYICSLPHCGTVKKVLKHIAVCRVGTDCPVRHCVSSRLILSHWINCTKPECPVCAPVRKANEIIRHNALQRELHSDEQRIPPSLNTYMPEINVPTSPNVFSVDALIRPSTIKEWHKEISSDARLAVIKNIVQELENKKMCHLFNHARQIESRMLDIASDPNHYYQLVNEEIQVIREIKF